MLATVMFVLSGCTFSGSAGHADAAPSSAGTTGAPHNPSDPALLPFPPTGIAVVQENGIVYRVEDGQRLTVNACTPAHPTGPVPAVLIIHGGGFARGSNSSEGTRSLCLAVAEAGMAGFSVEYRLAPTHPFPAAIDDVQAAVVWLREAAQVARFGIDPNRVGVLGTSAGATLAMELGTLGDGDLASGSRVAAVVALSGASDITAAGLALGDLGENRIDLVKQYLDCPALENCPKAKDASPLYQVDPSDAPLFIAHSVNELIPVEQAEAMIQAMRSAGVTVVPHLLPGHRHGTAYLDTALWQDIVEFLRSSL